MTHHRRLIKVTKPSKDAAGTPRHHVVRLVILLSMVLTVAWLRHLGKTGLQNVALETGTYVLFDRLCEFTFFD